MDEFIINETVRSIGVEYNQRRDTHSAIITEMLRKTFVTFDIETTSLDYIGGKVIEIGAVKTYYEGRTGEWKCQTFDLLIHPGAPLPDFTKQLTGLSDQDMEDYATDEKFAFWKFNDFLKDADVLIGQNSNKFDIPYLTYHMARNGIMLNLPDLVIDTLDVSRFIEPWEKTHKLGEIAKRHNVPYDSNSHHRADYDSDLTFKVFLKLMYFEPFARMPINAKTAKENDVLFIDSVLRSNKSPMNVHSANLIETQVKPLISAISGT